MLSIHKYITFLSLFLSISGFSYPIEKEKIIGTGSKIFVDQDGKVPYGHEFWINTVSEDIVKLDSLYKANPNIEYLEDKAYLLMVQFKYDEAINQYLQINELEPNNYNTALNLAWLYEFKGDYISALKWIENALSNSSDNHHIDLIQKNILQIKSGQSVLNSISLIKTDFGKADKPVTSLSEKALKILAEQIFYQINERLSFKETQDEILAQLLFEYGNVMFLTNHKEEAKEVYNMAIQNGFVDPIIKNRLVLLETKNQDSSDFILVIKQNWDTIIISVIAILAFVFVLNKKNKKISR